MKMTNNELVEKFFNGVGCKHTLNRISTMNEIFSYKTLILHYDSINNKYYLNIANYSVTTSKLQREIMNFLVNKNVVYYYGRNYGQNYDNEDFQIKPVMEYKINDKEKIIIDLYKNNENLDFYLLHNAFISKINRKILKDKQTKEPYIRLYGTKYYIKDFTKLK